MNDLVTWTAAAAGVSGTLLLAGRGRLAGWGFVLYLVSNAGWLAFAWRGAHWPLLAQTLAFTLSSLFGVWRWLLWPRLNRAAPSTLE